ncbi:unnamed protein product [Angiostrongylus costaricensis]|uniref:Glyco_18 domain-containing protein n=1 Tax=Angiostrongylus costaricensis TaxID=334426 RepID=A0A0R3Q1N9_ANGCS|nr:unnamed protein product [Angiostrongylus costaricensis]
MISFLIPLLFSIPHHQQYHMICYYKWNEPPLKDVDISLCSHIILIGQLYLDNLGHLQLPPDHISQDFSGLKKQRQDLKLLICLTGPNHGFSEVVSLYQNPIYRQIVSSTATMSTLADASYAFLKKFSFDGLDIDWEFPSWSSDSQKTDRQRFPLLLKTLRDKFGSTLLLTVAVSGPPTITKVAYETESFNRYVDLVNVMNYDFHIFSYFHPFVGFNAPLRKLCLEVEVASLMNSVTEASMLTWKKLGLWSNKTVHFFLIKFLLTIQPFVLKVFGIPTYGRGYRLINWRVNKPYSLASGTVDGLSKYSKDRTMFTVSVVTVPIHFFALSKKNFYEGDV